MAIRAIYKHNLQVMSETKYERIGGTSMGGGTFWGLGSLLTKAKVCGFCFSWVGLSREYFSVQGFDELLEMAAQGDHRTVDMLVKDIYGGAYSALGLPTDLIASSFGKAARSSQDVHGLYAVLLTAQFNLYSSLQHPVSVMWIWPRLC
jgi:type II pantothenate kinase